MKLEDFLKQLINKLNKQHIKYCILRNYETLPKTLKSGDIDFLIESKHKEQVEKIINSIKDIYVIGITKRSYVHNYFLYNIEKGGSSNALQVDFIFNYIYKGIEYLNINNILNNTRKYITNSFSFNIPSKIDETFIKFIPQYLHKGIINSKYNNEIIAEIKNSNLNLLNSFNIANKELLNNNLLDTNNGYLVLRKELKKNNNIKKYILHNLIELKLRLPFQNSKIIFIKGNIKKLENINVKLESFAKKIIFINIKNIFEVFQFFKINKNFTIFVFYINKKNLNFSYKIIIEKLKK